MRWSHLSRATALALLLGSACLGTARADEDLDSNLVRDRIKADTVRLAELEAQRRQSMRDLARARATFAEGSTQVAALRATVEDLTSEAELTAKRLAELRAQLAEWEDRRRADEAERTTVFYDIRDLLADTGSSDVPLELHTEGSLTLRDGTAILKGTRAQQAAFARWLEDIRRRRAAGAEGADPRALADAWGNRLVYFGRQLTDDESARKELNVAIEELAAREELSEADARRLAAMRQRLRLLEARAKQAEDLRALTERLDTRKEGAELDAARANFEAALLRSGELQWGMAPRWPESPGEARQLQQLKRTLEVLESNGMTDAASEVRAKVEALRREAALRREQRLAAAEKDFADLTAYAGRRQAERSARVTTELQKLRADVAALRQDVREVRGLLEQLLEAK